MEYIGSTISLISKSDIRYIGCLVEISSENSTVSLENVRSMGTEDRRTGEDAIKPSDRVYQFIVFRGSDVKDLRIEEQPKQSAPPPSAVPDDPAILGSTRPPQQTGTPNHPQQPPFAQPPPYNQGPPGGFPPYPPHMHNQGFGRGSFPGGPPGGPGGPGFGYPPGPGPYGPPPPGWYPPQQHGFPPGGPGGPGPFSPQPPTGSAVHHQGPQGPRGQQPAPIGPAKDAKAPEQKKPEVQPKPEPVAAKAPVPAPAPASAAVKKAPTPPMESKPDVAAATAPPATVQKAAPSGPKNRAPIPINPAARPATQPTATQAAQSAANTAQTYASATQAATAAVAAAMAKLPMAQKMGQNTQQGGGESMDNLTKKVQEMRTDDRNRHGQQPGMGGYAARGRGRGRGGHHGQQTRQVEVPTTDYDFESANAKFNKDDLVKEAIASGSPLGTPGANGEASTNGTANGETREEEVIIPKGEVAYDKKKGFFDNISSELKDRDGNRGQEFRTEERKKNFETFGQGSVDSYRRGFGRGRGRGFRGGGRGFGGQRGGPGGQGGGYNSRPRGGAPEES